MTDEEATRDASTFERHTQTALVILVVGLLGWVGLTVNNNQLELARITVQVDNLLLAVTAPQERINALERRVDIMEEALLADQKAEE